MHPFTRTVLEADRTASPATASESGPETIAEADTIQFEVIEALGGHGGWKVTPWSSPNSMLAAPIPKAWMWRSADTVKLTPGSRLEVEFALVHQENGWQVCLALEFLRSRLAGQDWSPLARRADLLSAGGIVVGPARPLAGLLSGEAALTLTHSTSETVIVTTTFDPETLMLAVDWLEEHAARLGQPIAPGTVVITSARIGPLPLVEGTYRASWTGLDDVAVTISSS
jgi:hypothetical protein